MNMEEYTINNKQWMKIEQWIMINETLNNEKLTENNEHYSKNNEQWIINNEQRTMKNE